MMARAGTISKWQRRGAIPIAAALAILPSCDHAAPPPPAAGPLPPGVAARVDHLDVTADHIARIAAAQRIPLAEARDLAVTDALLTRGAQQRGLDRSPDVQQQIQAALARALLHRILADARAHPPTDEELRAAAARKWLDVDRPEGFRTVHAVVRFNPDTDGEGVRPRARAVAEAIRAAVQPIADRAASMPLPEGAPLSSARQRPGEDPDPLSSAFRKTAARVPRDNLDVIIEPLPPVAADGRVLAPGDATFDLEFSKAAAALRERGQLAPLFTSPFGYHVVMLLERTPAQILTGPARAARLFDDIVNDRARAAEKRLLTTLKPAGAVSPDAPGLIDLVRVSVDP